ncbi:MAG: hypothetical protein A2V79_00715 [Betaproteobacteria bacterium RBG_16_56_24]|nr:MAG: hypothetical protein A2V79_00715 [Betaproteobacteria bacterium RBG_16_56_24]
MLPSIHKKLVYLDQSFLSAACLEADNPNSQNEVRIFSKLTELKVRQRVFVVVSDVHSRETSAIPDEYVGSRRELWQFQNDLADGSISVDWDEVFVAQWRRIFANQDNSNSFPASDIGLDNPHQFQVGMRIQLTNHWRPKLHRDNARPRDAVNEAFRRVFERQLENMPSCEDARDCLSYVRELWYKNIRQGIASWRQRRDLHLQMEQIVKELEAGRIPVMPPWEAPAPFCRVVGEAVQELDEESTLQQWLVSLEGDSANLCACVRIRSVLEAALLWKWKTEGATVNPKKFDIRFGQSRQNDIDHISTFIPYVDALTTDNDMRNLCKNEVVADELERFSCKIFSKSNYDEFEAWLDALLAESMTHNVRVHHREK